MKWKKGGKRNQELEEHGKGVLIKKQNYGTINAKLVHKQTAPSMPIRKDIRQSRECAPMGKLDKESHCDHWLDQDIYSSLCSELRRRIMNIVTTGR